MSNLRLGLFHAGEGMQELIKVKSLQSEVSSPPPANIRPLFSFKV